MASVFIPQRPFAQTGRSVSRVGLGGEGVLRTDDRESEAQAVIRAALAEGITYFDSARVYASSEIYLGSVWGGSKEMREEVFQASKSASRDRDGALHDLAESLARLQTDRLDLWQIHDVRTEQDLDAISGPGGALEAFREARAQGRVRAIGVTGHHDPGILARAVREWPVDSVMMPVNPVEGVLGGFLDQVLPLAVEKKMAVIGMKLLGASHYILPNYGVSAEMLIRYALSYPISLGIVGCATAGEVARLASAGRSDAPMSPAERQSLEARFLPHAKRMAFYRGVV